MRFKLIIPGIIIVAIIAVTMFMVFRKTDSAMARFAAGGPVATTSYIKADNPTPNQPAHFCPTPESLIKEDVKWTTTDKKWENYTPSSANKIISFTGAQWVGIKVGKVICLYQTDEAVAFPVALEQTKSALVLEPTSSAWSSLVGNRKFCKSASTADCPYFFEPPKDASNIYKEIEYSPNKEADL